LSGASSAKEDIVQKLTNASLLTTEGDLSQKTAFIEVAHEALIRSWPQFRKWIDADRAGLRTRTRLTEAARDWKNAGRDPAYLYTGARLAVAKEWEALHAGELCADEAEFLRCSLEAQEKREAHEARDLKERAEAAEKHARELKRRAVAAAATAGAALILLTFSIVELYREKLATNSARTSELAADGARDRADDLAGAFLFDLRSKLEPVGLSYLLNEAAERAEEYLIQLPPSAMTNPRLRMRSVTLAFKGDVLLARGEPSSALRAYQHSLSDANILAAKDQGNPDWQHDLVLAYLKVGICIAQTDGRDALGQANKFLHTGLSLATSYAGRDRGDLIDKYNKALNVLSRSQ
jgi:hypothetical protein